MTTIPQPFELIFGLVNLVIGAAALGVCLNRVARRAINRSRMARFVLVAVTMTARGLSYCSRAFDPPRHDSPRTHALRQGALVVITAALLAYGVAWLRRKPEAGERGR